MEDAEFQQEIVRATPRVLRLAQRLAPEATDPEDLVQDVLERAWRSRTSFRGEASATTWLHRILVNRAADIATRARPTLVDLDVIRDEELLDLEVDDPALVLQRAADAEALRAALSRLQPLDRTVLVLHDGGGWSGSEIGETCAISADAAHKRLQRARLRLAREIGEEPTVPDAETSACHEARAAASDYLDGRVDRPTRELVETHLTCCTRCPPLVQALVGLRSTLADSPDPAVPVRLRASLEHIVEPDGRG